METGVIIMNKQYVRVSGTWEKDGLFNPLFVLWDNGAKYRIERIIQCCPAIGKDMRPRGLRYTCLFAYGQKRYLYFIDNHWFIEKEKLD